MRVAILYSGGKDSTYAIESAMKKGWEIAYLLSIKPTRKDCFLFHYATVEHTKELAGILNVPHIYASCSVANPVEEASLVRDIVAKNPVDAVILGGIGLQVTQLRSIQMALLPMKIETFAMHAGEDHDIIIEQMLKKGYEIIITQIASDGLSGWLGERLTVDNLQRFRDDSRKYGFHIGGEGGYYDTLVVDGLIFRKRLMIEETEKIMEDSYSGHINIKLCRILDKVIVR